MNINRKKFLKLSALASGSIFVPEFLHGFSSSLKGLIPETDRKLIIIQMSGGNDGLNTFIPYQNDLYYKLRPTLSYSPDSLIKLTDETGMNPGMKSLSQLYNDGDLCIINNVGYPNPDHSHFRSMDVWTSGSGSDKYDDSGWIGRYLDAQCDACSNSLQAIEVDDTLSNALRGKTVKGMAISNPERLYRTTLDPFFKKIADGAGDYDITNDTRSYLYKTIIETTSSVSYIYNQSRIYKSTVDYPSSSFGKALKQIAELICSGTSTQVYYVSLTGFDTHVRQKLAHEKLLGNFSDSIAALTIELKKKGRFDDTLIMAFSEFGRRVGQNASGGTDHGEANNLMILGGSLKQKGFINPAPSLDDLVSGNLKYKIDFRAVYATVLNKWLLSNDEKILGGKFDQMNFI